jgi:signal transduction histidine kinase
LDNLVDNALKYGLEESPDRVVEIRCAPEDDHVRLEVEDHGRGVSPIVAERVFDPLFRGDPSLGQGLGLGLAIVKRLVEGRTGTVQVRPGRTRGSLFLVTLPVVAAAAVDSRPPPLSH